MKRIIAFLIALSSLLISCSSISSISFSENEYTIRSGERIQIKENVSPSYEIVSSYDKEHISLNRDTGVFNFDESIGNSYQVLCVAKYQNLISSPIVVTLINDYKDSVISFSNMSNYIMNGEYVTASSSLGYAITYSLKIAIPGISINSSSGRVTFDSTVKNLTTFTVVANSHDSIKEKEFLVLKEGFVFVNNKKSLFEKSNIQDAKFIIDYSDSIDAKEDGILGVSDQFNSLLNSKYYSYNKVNQTLTITKEYISSLGVGFNYLKIITSKNTIEVIIEVADLFIREVKDLISINKDQASLSGHYVLANDIDLAPAFKEGGESYNEGKGWEPIGSYEDVFDYNIATRNSFKGYFDGNGHTIYNLTANRSDNKAYNFGLFGYTTSSSVIKNVGVTGVVNVRSYSGGLVGTNNGIIENCWSSVNITVDDGGTSFRRVGGLVGNNMGTISSSLSYGNVKSEKEFGTFVGFNEGTIINCFACKTSNCFDFVGFGTIDESCVLFSSYEEMKNNDYINVLDGNVWILKKGNIPLLRVQFIIGG